MAPGHDGRWKRPLRMRISGFIEEDHTVALEKITVPALAMNGEADQIVPCASSGPASGRTAENGTLKTYAGFPHGMPTTHADPSTPTCWPSSERDVELLGDYEGQRRNRLFDLDKSSRGITLCPPGPLRSVRRPGRSTPRRHHLGAAPPHCSSSNFAWTTRATVRPSPARDQRSPGVLRFPPLGRSLTGPVARR